MTCTVRVTLACRDARTGSCAPHRTCGSARVLPLRDVKGTAYTRRMCCRGAVKPPFCFALGHGCLTALCYKVGWNPRKQAGLLTAAHPNWCTRLAARWCVATTLVRSNTGACVRYEAAHTGPSGCEGGQPCTTCFQTLNSAASCVHAACQPRMQKSRPMLLTTAVWKGKQQTCSRARPHRPLPYPPPTLYAVTMLGR